MLLNFNNDIPFASTCTLNNLSAIAKLDSGATRHLFKTTHSNHLNDITMTTTSNQIILPNNEIIKAKQKGFLNLHPTISKKASETLIVSNLLNESLLSVGQLCDDGCCVCFDNNGVNVIKNETIIMNGRRNKTDGLWDVPLDRMQGNSKKTNNLNYIITKDKSKTELAQYLHAALFSPPISTLENAIKNGNLTTFPGIHNLNFKSLLRTTIATEKCHLDQEGKNLRSTQQPTENEFFPVKNPTKTKEWFTSIETVDKFVAKNVTYSDLTGRFPHQSSRGNKYIIILYDYDSNAILMEPLKSRQAGEITTAFNKIYARLTKNIIEQKLFIMDNECSNDLKFSIIKNNNQYQLVPPNQHRRNATENAIQTFKNHFLSGLATCDTKYPIEEWD